MRPTIIILVAVLTALPLSAPLAEEEGRSRLDEVLDAVVANELALVRTLDGYRPLVETYVQTLRNDPALGSVPVADDYSLGRLEPGEKKRKARKRRNLNILESFASGDYRPANFTRMLTLGHENFERDLYWFDFIRAEFLGEVRCLVFDVTPRAEKVSRMTTGRFTGRIWVEDEDFHIVRYNGIYSSALSSSFQFDSWRLLMPSGEWLPAYVYTEELHDLDDKKKRTSRKGQTRIWGYTVDRPDVDDEFTKVLVDAPRTEDRLDRPGQVSPLASRQAWETEAEDNMLHRLERAGLIAARSSVDEVLETVVRNLEITNGLTIDPPVRCRVLLTTPLESFSVGHTIVVSRGLVDVLADEASLAMVLAHELGHILGGHELETQYAFSNQMLTGDKKTLELLAFAHPPEAEAEADARGLELLARSPYGEHEESAGLFLRTLLASDGLSALLKPHFGHGWTGERGVRMGELAERAPALDPGSLSQVAALPLGSRVQLDPWNARIELLPAQSPALQSPKDKLALQVTPLMPYLSRKTADAGTETAVAR